MSRRFEELRRRLHESAHLKAAISLDAYMVSTDDAFLKNLNDLLGDFEVNLDEELPEDDNE